MSEEASSNEKKSGKVTVIALIVIVLVGAGAWVWIESQMPILDKADGKRMAAVYEKRCSKKLPVEKCRENIGKRHTECLLRAASKTEDDVMYDPEIYVVCIDE